MKKYLLALCALLVFAFAQEIKVDVDLSHESVKAEDATTVYLRVKLTGFEVKEEAKRTPLNVALVLDRSGSMSGEKIEKTKEAAIAFVNRLKKEDIVSIITYDDRVDVLLAATKLSDRTRVIEKIKAIQVGGSTALYAGVDEGAKELRKFMDKTCVNRLILLSDGQANVGPQTPEALGTFGAALVKEGISVTTLGLGDGYNEDLMSQLAAKSDGNHKFLRTSEDIEHFFNKELGAIGTIVATDVKIIIYCAEGVKPVRVLDLDAKINNGEIKSGFNQIYSAHERYMLIELNVPAMQKDQKREIASVEVDYHDMQTQKEAQIKRVSILKAEDKAVEKRDVMISVVEQLATIANEEAVKLRDQGRIEEAKKALQQNSQMLQEKAKSYAAPKLSEQAQENEKAIDNLDDDKWNAQRKEMRDKQTKRAFKGAL